ncbi:MAG: hypothetical protein SGI77_19560 [Pirellulaceae bacterium]|nr:hypothetical protein [Pirellulaceae bacterium]
MSVVFDKTKYVPEAQAYIAAFGHSPTTPTLRRKRQLGLKAIWMSGQWLTTVQNVIKFEEAYTAKKCGQTVEKESSTRSTKSREKSQLRDDAYLSENGVQ